MYSPPSQDVSVPFLDFLQWLSAIGRFGVDLTLYSSLVLDIFSKVAWKHGFEVIPEFCLLAVIAGKIFNLFGTPFPHLKNEENNNFSWVSLKWNMRKCGSGPEYLCLLPQPVLKSPASSALRFSIQDPEGLSQLDCTSLTGAHLFAFFPSFSFGFSFKLDFLLCYFSPFSFRPFLPSCFTHTHLYACPPLFMLSPLLLLLWDFRACLCSSPSFTKNGHQQSSASQPCSL